MRRGDAHQIEKRRIRNLTEEVDAAGRKTLADFIEKMLRPGRAGGRRRSIRYAIAADDDRMSVRARGEDVGQGPHEDVIAAIWLEVAIDECHDLVAGEVVGAASGLGRQGGDDPVGEVLDVDEAAGRAAIAGDRQRLAFESKVGELGDDASGAGARASCTDGPVIRAVISASSGADALRTLASRRSARSMTPA